MEIVAHRAGNSAETARSAEGNVDMIELDVHVLRGQVEVRHAKVLHPSKRLWEKWYLLPTGAAGAPIDDVLSALDPATPLMIDLKCFSRRSSRRILRSLPSQTPVVVSTRSWWVLRPFVDRPATRLLRSCGTSWQLLWVRRYSRLGPNEGVCVHEKRLTSAMVRALLQRSALLFSWGATTTERVQELAEAGLTGVILDDYDMVEHLDF